MGDTVIIRHRSEKNFTVLDNAQIRDARLSWKARGLVAYLLSLPEGWQLRIAQLVEQAPDGRHSTRAGLAELQKTGYLIIERERNPRGRFERTTWTIIQTPRVPSLVTSNHQASAPRSENQIVDSSHHDPENQILVKRTGTTEVPTLRRTTTTGIDGLSYPSLSSDERVVVDRLIHEFDEPTAQALLDELAGAVALGRIRTSRLGYMRGMATKVKSGNFIPELGIAIADTRSRRRLEDLCRDSRRLEDQQLQRQRSSESGRAAFEKCLTACATTLGVTSEGTSLCLTSNDGRHGDLGQPSMIACARGHQPPVGDS